MRRDEALSVGPPRECSSLKKKPPSALIRPTERHKGRRLAEKNHSRLRCHNCGTCGTSLSHWFDEFGDKVVRKCFFQSFGHCPVLDALVHARFTAALPPELLLWSRCPQIHDGENASETCFSC